MAIKYKHRKIELGDETITSILKIEDGNPTLNIPKDSANTDYQKYLEWVAAGNTTEAAD